MTVNYLDDIKALGYGWATRAGCSVAIAENGDSAGKAGDARRRLPRR